MTKLVGPSAASSRVLEAAALALKLAPKEIRNDINRTSRAEMAPEWIELIGSKTAGMPDIDQRVLKPGARVKPGNPVALLASTSKRPLSGGLVPNDNSRGFEFGTDKRDKYSTYTRRNESGSGSHTVKRRAGRHLPNRVRKGRAVFPAAAEILPRFVSLHVQIVVRKIYEAHEKG